MESDYRDGEPGFVAGSDTSESSAAKMLQAAKQIWQLAKVELAASSEALNPADRGLAVWELQSRLALLPHQDVGPRVSEASKRGEVMDSGRRRVNPKTGRKQVVWVLVSGSGTHTQQKTED